MPAAARASALRLAEHPRPSVREAVEALHLALGRVVPRVRDIRAVSAAVAAAAAQTAVVEGIVQRMPPAGDLVKHMQSLQYDPAYLPLYNDVY